MMTAEWEKAFLVGAFWGCICLLYGWTHPDKALGKLGSAIKCAAIGFIVMTLVSRGCAVLLPSSGSDDLPECERHPGIYGC
jgi:FtsH-binding integral membrane protein